MSHQRARRPLLATIATTALVLTALATAPPATAGVGPTPRVLINEVYGGGGNSGALFNRDFIELYNATDAAVDLTGWSVQYGAATNTNWTGKTLLAGEIAPGGYLLVGEAFGAGTTLPGFDVDIDGSIAMGGGAGKVALTNSATTLTCAGAAVCAADAAVVDLVGYGASVVFAGAAPAPATSNAQSVSRSSEHTNTPDNAADFAAVSPPTPMNSGSSEPDPEPEPEPTDATIAEIQAAGPASPFAGEVVTTRGVVTASYPTGGFNGYVIQTPGTGGAIDLATHTASDAIFVYSPGTTVQPIGAYVEVTGTVTEFGGPAGQPGLTEITVAAASDVVVLTETVTAPAAATISWPATAEARESLESMLIQPQGSYTVSNTFTTNQFGEVGLAFGTTPLRQPTDVARPGTPEAAAVAADNVARGVTLDDGASTNFLSSANKGLTPPYVSLAEPLVVGASATFTAPLVVDWRNGVWKLNPTAAVIGDGSGDDPVTFSNPRSPAPDAVGGDFSVASFNVLNYFTTLGTDSSACVPFVDRDGDGVTVNSGCDQRGAWDAADLERQQDKIVKAIDTLDADVVGLLEIENSAALGEAADEATATLVAALNAFAGTSKWAYIPSSAELPDVSLQDVIRNAIIYQPAAVRPLGASRALGTQSADDQAFGNAREPIGQVFVPAGGGETFLFVVNHFKSKGSAGPWPGDADTGDGQGASNESRVRQATALRDWVEEIRGSVRSVVLAGDFNSYGQEDPLQVLYTAGYADAEHALGIDTSSYSFSGLSGSLDHILLNGPALARATGGDIWNINSGESVALEYSRYNSHGTLFYADDPYRSSDHDPVVIGLRAGEDARAASTTVLVAVPPVHINRLLPTTLVAGVALTGRTAAAGTVEFREGDTVIGSAVVRHGTATLRLPNTLSKGTHRCTATFVPTDPLTVVGSTSRAVSVVVLR